MSHIIKATWPELHQIHLSKMNLWWTQTQNVQKKRNSEKAKCFYRLHSLKIQVLSWAAQPLTFKCFHRPHSLRVVLAHCNPALTWQTTILTLTSSGSYLKDWLLRVRRVIQDYLVEKHLAYRQVETQDSASSLVTRVRKLNPLDWKPPSNL
jgi:hypothetical protein